MRETFIDLKIDHLKPKMKVLRELAEIPLTPQTVIQAKVDGELSLVVYNRDGETFTVNKWGRKRWDFPALNQMIEALKNTPIQKAEFLAELYAKKGEKPLKLPDFIRHVKSKNPEDHKYIHIGIWDWIKTDGHEVNQPYIWKYQELEAIFKNCTNVGVLPYFQPQNLADVKTIWDIYVAKLGFEGLVIRNNNEVYKLKPKGDIDAVIVAVNKKSGYGKPNLFSQQMVTSLHIALMNENGEFIEIGDVASGIDEQLRKALWRLMDFKIGEDDKHVWIKPFLIAQIEYTELFQSKNKVYKLTPQGYQQTGETRLIRLRHPRLIRFRPDKKPTPSDVSIQQIPAKYLMETDVNGSKIG